jgi:hypothetical protein
MDSSANAISIFSIDPGLFVFSIFLGLWIAPIILSIWLARRDGLHWAIGFVLAFFLGWIGFVIVLVLGLTRPRPDCRNCPGHQGQGDAGTPAA